MNNEYELEKRKSAADGSRRKSFQKTEPNKELKRIDYVLIYKDDDSSDEKGRKRKEFREKFKVRKNIFPKITFR